MLILWVSWTFYRTLPGTDKFSGPPVNMRRLVDHLLKEESPHLLLPATLISNNQSFPLSVLIDSVCEQNLIDSALVQQMAIETEPLTVLLRVTAIDGKGLPQITHQTKPLQLVISGNQSELTSFFVFPMANFLVILGFKWLQQHNPHINWLDKHFESWSASCHSSCLHSAVPPGPSLTQPQETDPPNLSTIPDEYHDLAPVFSKSNVTSSSSLWLCHWPYIWGSITLKPSL